MSDSITQAQEQPNILSLLPALPDSIHSCSPAIQQKIDLMLLALEALKAGTTEEILRLAKQLNLDNLIKNRLVLWRMRCTNPLRNSYRRQNLQLDEAKALVIIIHYLAKSLEILIRQRLTDTQFMVEKNLPVNNHFQLSQYLEQFRQHFRNRMNRRRVKVMTYLENEDELNDLALDLLSQLLFCTGTRGIERFWISLFDGEIK